MDPLVAAFNQQYPDIRVDWIRLTAAQQASRFLGEAEAGVTTADVLNSGSSAMFQDRAELFATMNAELVPNSSLVTAPADNDAYVVISSNTQHVVYNTDLTNLDELKKHLATWKDLADDYWKGKVALTDPAASTIYMSWYRAMRATYGDDYLKALGRNNADFTASGVPAAQQVAAGAFALAIPLVANHSKELRDSGAPVAIYLPDGPGHGNESALGIAAAAPHPNAARVFSNWMLGPKAQALLCEFEADAVVPGAPCHRPADFLKSTDIIPQAEQDEITALLAG
jgi:iron(III) transport system substrate-binding protein